MGQNITKSAIRIVINRLNTIKYNDRIYILSEDIEHTVSDGQGILLNGDKYCVVKRFRKKEELLPKSQLDRIQVSSDISVINDRGCVNCLPKKSILELVEFDDNKITITLFPGTKIQNCYTREEIILETRTEVTIVN